MKTIQLITPRLLQLVVISVIVPVCIFSCKDKNFSDTDPIGYTWNFKTGTEGWTGDFANYPKGDEAFYKLLFEHEPLPEPLDQNQRALKLSAINHNHNLFMFIKKKITGLEPNSVYYMTFAVEFVSNVPDEYAYKKESRQELMHLSAGASAIEPVKVPDENNIYGMNIDICDQEMNGEDMVILGNFTNGTVQPEYILKTFQNNKPFHRETNEKGELWIILGAESSLDSVNVIYYNSIRVDFF